jgi:LacI family transcriptional regulator
VNSKPRILLLLDTQHIFDRKVFEGFSSTLRSSHLSWMIETLSIDQCDTALTIGNHWDAVVANCDSDATQALIAELNLPTIALCGQPVHLPERPGLVAIMPDHEGICRHVIDFFSLQGLKQFAVFTGLNSEVPAWVEYRSSVFINLLRENGYNVSKIKTVDDLTRLTQQTPVGTFCVSDKFARELMTLCDHSNTEVPNDLSIIGVDDDPLESSLSPKKITSVRFNPVNMGKCAVMELRQLLAEKNSLQQPKTIVIPAEPIHVGHTTLAHLDDVLVNRAIAYIRQNFHTGIKADQVASQFNVSRSHLNERFNRCLNQTVHHFLLTERLQFVTEQLTTTDRSITDIANQVGFSSKNYLFKCFKQHTGMSPLEYRATHLAH